MKILLCEDDAQILENLCYTLEKEGFYVISTTGQQQALEAAQTQDFDLALLDIRLPDGNGYALCTAIKRLRGVPVIFLSAASQELDVVTGFDLGADDYIPKPFRPMELISRINNVLRRAGKAQAVFTVENIVIDTVSGVVNKDDEQVFLTAMEYRLLLNLLANRGAVLSREQLLSNLWDVAGDYVNDNTLTVYIKRLREKIEEDPQNPHIVQTVRGMGYRLLK